jgi:hypothetical protein
MQEISKGKSCLALHLILARRSVVVENCIAGAGSAALHRN